MIFDQNTSLVSIDQLISMLGNPNYELCRGQFTCTLSGESIYDIFLKSDLLKTCYVFSSYRPNSEINARFCETVVTSITRDTGESPGLSNMYSRYFGNDTFAWTLNLKSVTLCPEADRKAFILLLVR